MLLLDAVVFLFDCHRGYVGAAATAAVCIAAAAFNRLLFSIKTKDKGVRRLVELLLLMGGWGHEVKVEKKGMSSWGGGKRVVRREGEGSFYGCIGAGSSSRSLISLSTRTARHY